MDDPDLSKRSLVLITVPYFVGKVPAAAFIRTRLNSSVCYRTGIITRAGADFQQAKISCEAELARNNEPFHQLHF